jgi:hypothetical protein
MLKRFSHIILSVLLLATTTGMAVSKHYCSGDIMASTIFSEAESCCDGPCDCCHNENHFYQVQDDFSGVPSQDVPQSAEINVLGNELLSFELASEIESKLNPLIFVDSPPPPKIQEVLSLKQSYLL